MGVGDRDAPCLRCSARPPRRVEMGRSDPHDRPAPPRHHGSLPAGRGSHPLGPSVAVPSVPTRADDRPLSLAHDLGSLPGALDPHLLYAAAEASGRARMIRENLARRDESHGDQKTLPPLTRKAMPNPASAETIPMISIWVPLRNGRPTVVFAFHHPIANK